jgi:replicative DNA helicase
MFLCDINKGQYISRQLNDEKKRFSKGNGGAYCWNTDNLDKNKVIFVTEGETDCLTLLLCGYYAVSMTSAGNTQGLFSLVANNQDKYFIVCYDNDEKGIEQKNKFNQQCNAKEIVNYIIFPISKKTPDVKDINDWYNADKSSLLEKLQEYFEVASQYWDIYIATQQEQAKKELADFNITNNIDTIINDIFNSTSGYKLIGDEYNELNNCIDGFKTGITVLGGGEGSGKTTLINQFIDNFAEQNIKTLVFSTEMLSRHIVARSTSRYHFNNAVKEANFDTLMYKNSDFLYGKDYTTKQYIDSDEVRETKARLLKDYATSLNNNLTISDLVNDYDIIRKQIIQFSVANESDNKVVVIDYLQNLTLNHDEIKADDEINKITFILMALKVLASKYNLVIVVLSSLNKMGKREGDTDSTVLMGTVNLAHLAELILILQNGEIKIEKEKAKSNDNKNKNGWKLITDEKKTEVYRYKDARFYNQEVNYIKSKLAIVKNRYGANNKTIYFKFYQAFSYFAPVFDNQIEQAFALKNIVGGIPTKENNRKETEFYDLVFDDNGNTLGDKDELERLKQSNDEIPLKNDDDDDLDTGDIN